MSLFDSIPAVENNIYLVTCPYPPTTKLPTQLQKELHKQTTDSIIQSNFIPSPVFRPADQFPIQVTLDPGVHREGRKYSYFEYFKRSLSGEAHLITSYDQDPEQLVLELSYEIAYLGFTIFSPLGNLVQPVHLSELKWLPELLPHLINLPLPPPEILETAHYQAAAAIKLAQKNRRNVSAFRSRIITPQNHGYLPPTQDNPQ